MKYKLTEVGTGIFCATFDNAYDLAMTFCRYQEYYESTSTKFRDKKFTLIDYMEWYSENMGKGSFTYPLDWAGFNIPSVAITKLFFLGIDDINKYDSTMGEIVDEIDRPNNFYLIGVLKGDEKTINHEFAHGLYFTNAQYKKTMLANIKLLDKKTYGELKKCLTGMGYCAKVIDDEIQAYLSTGIFGKLKEITIDKAVVAKFKKTFKEYKND